MSGMMQPRPDQMIDPPPMVVAPGGSAGVFRGRLVVISGSSSTGASGLFAYSPTPGKNNLVYSIVPGAGHDSYGNTTFAGATSYVHTGGVYYAIAVSAGSGVTPAITYYQSPGDQTSVYTIMFALSAYTNAGGSPGLSLVDVPSAVPPNAWDGPLVALSPANVAESWHAASLVNSWANSGTGPNMQYRLCASPPNTVEIIGDMSAGTLTSPTTIFTLPAGYRPTNVQSVLPIASGGGSGLVVGTSRIVINTTGTVQATGMAGFTGGGRIFIHYFISLDA